jgi:capsid portal protein
MNLIKSAKVFISKADKKSKDLDGSAAGTYQYPFEIGELTLKYIGNPYHNQCIDIKAMNILGEGLPETLMTILESITPQDSAYMLLHKTIRDLEIYGNAFWEIVASPTQIFHIPAQTMTKTYKGYRQQVNTDTVDFLPENIFHFKYASPLSTIYGAPGYLPILPVMRLYHKIIRYNEQFFANNAIPDMAIVVEGGEIAGNALYNIQSFFRQKFAGYENAHKVLYLPVRDGMNVKFEKLQTDRKDASFMELMKQCITDIIACHGVPPRLISIVNQSQLGGSGETAGQMDIFNKCIISPKQKIFSGLLEEMNKLHHIFPDNADFTLTPIEYTQQQSDLDNLLRRV